MHGAEGIHVMSSWALTFPTLLKNIFSTSTPLYDTKVMGAHVFFASFDRIRVAAKRIVIAINIILRLVDYKQIRSNSNRI